MKNNKPRFFLSQRLQHVWCNNGCGFAGESIQRGGSFWLHHLLWINMPSVWLDHEIRQDPERQYFVATCCFDKNLGWIFHFNLLFGDKKNKHWFFFWRLGNDVVDIYSEANVNQHVVVGWKKMGSLTCLWWVLSKNGMSSQDLLSYWNLRVTVFWIKKTHQPMKFQ